MQSVRERAIFLDFDDRSSDSPFIERVWRCRSARAGTFVSVAASHWELVLTRHQGAITVTLRGPETKPTAARCPADAEWIGVRFKLGTFMPKIPVRKIMNRNDMTLPAVNAGSFWLGGWSWKYPDFENAEAFATRLARRNIIARDPAVEAGLRGEPEALSMRSVQRHFLQATGITHRLFRQIERARYATMLLRRGATIMDAVHDAGYFDQAHLSRSLKTLIGETPSKIMRADRQLSFLYEATPFRESEAKYRPRR